MQGLSPQHRSRPAAHRNRSNRRNGLAPLELVLCLPILLFVMGLMILIGWAGVYKIRAQVNSREAAWRSIWRANPRSDAQDLPNPPGFPPPGRISVARGVEPSLLQGQPPPLGAFDDHPVVRGPVLVSPQGGQALRVNREVLEMRDGLIEGRVEFARGFRVMGRMPPGGYRLDKRFAVLDNRWQFWQQKLSSNRSRRSLQIYPDLAGDWQRVTTAEAQRFGQAAAALRNDPLRANLVMLERDPTLKNYYGGFIDYYPGLPSTRTADRGALRQIANRLIDRIQGTLRPRSNLGQAGVPGRLTQDFLRMYKDLRQRAEDMGLSEEPYRSLIDQLEEFEQFLLD